MGKKQTCKVDGKDVGIEETLSEIILRTSNAKYSYKGVLQEDFCTWTFAAEFADGQCKVFPSSGLSPVLSVPHLYQGLIQGLASLVEQNCQ